jgi:diguanylate cyclase (GGDEF)-like protein
MAGSVGGVEAVRGPHAGAWADRRCTWLLAACVSAGVGSVLASLAAIWGTGTGVDLLHFLVAVVAVVGSQLTRIRIQVNGDSVFVGWSEVGAIAVLCLLPPIWAPLATLVATVIALAPRWPKATTRGRIRAVYAAAVLVVATTVAAGVAAAVADPLTPIQVLVDRPLTVAPLVLASAALFGVGTLLMSVWLASTGLEPALTMWRRITVAKRTMMAGTAAVGLATAVVIGINMLWLVVLAPVLWALHRVYEHQLRGSLERVTWATLADATRGLNQLDERGVAQAVLRGAARLFRPDAIEVVLVRPQGSRRTFRARAADLLVGSVEVTIVDEPGTASSSTVDSGPYRTVVPRRLTIGGLEIGEVRLLLRGRGLVEAESHAFSAFAEAAASAFHDAATHRALRAMTARSAYDALHDPLTGLANRSTLLARGNAALRRVSGDAAVALILLDVRGLRQVNDTLGYAAGDELLAVMARRLRERQLDDELVGRLGGDEFAVLVTGVLSETFAVDRARELITELALPAQVSGVLIAVDAAAGVVVERAEFCDMAELLRRADVARHQAKQAAGRVADYEPALDPSNMDRLALLADLRDALATTDQFFVHLQPVVDLDTGQPVSVEALVRWRHPRRGLLLPADFIGTVEHSDLAAGFTQHVLDLALRLSAGWATQGVHVPVSVNLCARCTLNEDLPKVVAGRLAAHGVAPRQLILEITESVAVAEPGLAEQIVAGLRELGTQVSVDHFGTGSASLSFLTRFPVDEVKIDRSFVATMVDSSETAAIVRATVDLAHDLGMRVVAEGVEHPEQRAALVGLGVTAAQGSLFHPPLPVDEVTPVLQGRTHLATARRIPIVPAAPRNAS